MRVLIATSRRGLLGGVEKYLQSVIPGLLERGYSVGLLYEYPPNEAEEGIDSRTGQVPSWCSRTLELPALVHSLNDWSPDVVYSHGLDDNAVERALLDSYPTALYAHTYHGTCVSGRKCHSWPGIEPCDRQLGPGCLALYLPRRCGGLNPRTMWELYQLQSKRKSMLSQYSAVLVASQHMYREYERHGVPADRLYLVPLPIEGSPSGAAPPPRTLGSTILFVGRLIDVKGVDYLLRAIPLAAEQLGRVLTLRILGDGPERGKIEGLARRLGLTVNFAGWVNTDQRADLLRQADLVAVPSLWPEPFGLVGLEAGCFGVPAVGFAVGGIADWLIPGQSGELAAGNPATVEGLAQAIVRALANPAHYQRLREGAWALAKQFSLTRHLAQLEPILAAGERNSFVADNPEGASLAIKGWGKE